MRGLIDRGSNLLAAITAAHLETKLPISSPRAGRSQLLPSVENCPPRNLDWEISNGDGREVDVARVVFAETSDDVLPSFARQLGSFRSRARAATNFQRGRLHVTTPVPIGATFIANVCPQAFECLMSFGRLGVGVACVTWIGGVGVAVGRARAGGRRGSMQGGGRARGGVRNIKATSLTEGERFAEASASE